MNDFLSTNEILQMIEHSREPINQMNPDNQKQQTKLGKIFYWIIVGFSILHLIYLALPLFLTTNQMIQLVGSQPVAVVKFGQTPPELLVEVVKVKKYDFDDLNIGDVVVVFAETSGVYIEKEVISIDQGAQTFTASYLGQTLETYDKEDLAGTYVKDANVLQLFTYAVSTPRGYLGTMTVYIVILGIAYYMIFHQIKTQNTKDSDQNETT
ncbi:MAG: hypothetical protein AB7E61_07325 [Acholeplasmataceae bacterium]